MPQPIVMGVTEPNISVPIGRIAEGHKIRLYPLRSWRDYEWFVRTTKNREWEEAATIVLDSYTMVGDMVVNEAMSAPGALTGDGNLKQARWTGVKSDQFTELLDLLSATLPMPGKRAYHIVVTVHEQEEAVYDAEGKMTGISAINPAVPGGLRRSFAAKFDCVFIAQARTVYVKGANGLQRPAGTSHMLWTVPPDSLRSAKDGLGGNGGRSVLPPTIENNWSVLQESWYHSPSEDTTSTKKGTT
jgi:hypothetical protein